MTLAPASRRECHEFKIIFDNLIGWTLANATLVTLEWNLFFIPVSMCTGDTRWHCWTGSKYDAWCDAGASIILWIRLQVVQVWQLKHRTNERHARRMKKRKSVKEEEIRHIGRRSSVATKITLHSILMKVILKANILEPTCSTYWWIGVHVYMCWIVKYNLVHVS